MGVGRYYTAKGWVNQRELKELWQLSFWLATERGG